MSRPTISVIVPVYNVEHYISRCVQTLMTQSLEDIEYIFVDDCSRDESYKVLCDALEQYPSRKDSVRVIRHKDNRGSAQARNTGLSVATGEYIAYCDSDDYVHSDMYKLMYEKAINTDSDVVLCDVMMDFSTSMERYETISVGDRIKMVKAYIASEGTFLVNMIARKTFIDKNKLYNIGCIDYCEDFYLSVRQLFLANKVEKVCQPLYFYNRENLSSVMHNFNPKYINDERWVYESTIQFFSKYGVLSALEEELSWRVLKNKQDLVLNKETHEEFLAIFPTSHKYILTCPDAFCNRKIKVMMWLLTHHCEFLLNVILVLRKKLKNL